MAGNAHPEETGQLLIYETGGAQLQVRLEGRTVWLSQRLIAELYQVSVPTVNEHLASIFEERELDRKATIRSFRIVQREGSRDVARDIWASERMFYQKVTDIYATSIDYDPAHSLSQTFFVTVQNKLHWAIHGHTAAKIIRQRADAAVAKNYLSEEESRELNRSVSMYLDYAEDQARRKKPMHMGDWVAKLDVFLQFNERNILTHAGAASHQLAEEHAHPQFEQYAAARRHLEAGRPVSDFDRAVEAVKCLESGATEKQPRAKKAKRMPPQRRLPAGKTGKRKGGRDGR